MAERPSGEAFLERLRRPDKHYLGAGDGTLFAPPHPIWLDEPGYWDGGHVYLHGVAPLFTFALVDAGGRRLPLRAVERTWTPDALVVRHAGGGIEMEETRRAGRGGLFEVAAVVRGDVPAGSWVVAWTAQPGERIGDRADIEVRRGAVRFVRSARDAQGRGEPLPLECRLEVEGGEASTVHESQAMPTDTVPPRWEITPFYDRWTDGLAAPTYAADPEDGTRRLLYMAAAARLAPRADGGHDCRIRMWVRPLNAGLRQEERGEAGSEGWAEFFERAPSLSCSDERLERYFAYRWYGLRLNFLDPAGNYRRPTCAEGIEYFHCAISYSAWCHARELRWLPDPSRARGAVLTFLDHQRDDGSLPGRVYLDHMDRTDFYIADWGGAVLAVDAVHPDRGFLESCYGPLVRYADWLDRDRDAEGSGLFDVRDQYETGQEYMSRYTAVDPSADRQHFEYRLRLKGVDITVYAYRLRRALARIAAVLGRSGEVAAHDAAADRTAEAVRSRMWDPESGMFSDLDAATMRRTGVAAAVCFYPYLTDIAGPDHLDGLRRNLFDAGRFWTPFPVPSTAADDPTYSPDADWGGVRRVCTWNGRVWPMTNSHMVDVLATAASLDPDLKGRAAELLGRYVRMMFFEDDPARPNCFEHYSPVTGRPGVYRGIDDYQHSWVNDLLVRHAAGFRPHPDGTAVVDPLPMGLERLRLADVPWRGRTVGVELKGEAVRVTIDGEPAGETRVGQPLELRP